MKPRRRTYAELLAEQQYLSAENGLLLQALNCAIADRPDAVERVSVDGCRWTLRLYRASGCAGGIVVQSFAAPNQHAHVTAHYLDAMMANPAERYSSDEAVALLARAVDHLKIARNRLCDHAVIARGVPIPS